MRKRRQGEDGFIIRRMEQYDDVEDLILGRLEVALIAPSSATGMAELRSGRAAQAAVRPAGDYLALIPYAHVEHRRPEELRRTRLTVERLRKLRERFAYALDSQHRRDLLHTGEVVGSIPTAPTTESPILQGFYFCTGRRTARDVSRPNETRTRHVVTGNDGNLFPRRSSRKSKMNQRYDVLALA